MTSVLITRPRAAALQLAGPLGQLGLQPIVMPLYTFSPRQPEIDISTALVSGNRRTIVIFTSPRAVRFGLEHIPTDLLSSLEFAAVGAATRARLEASNLQVTLQADSGFTSEDLLQVPALAVDPGLAVIFCAPGGRRKLAAGLQELGWSVSMAMVYERQPLKPSQQQVDELLAAGDLVSVWTSISAFDLARELLPAAAWDKILHTPALVISARIKHHLQQAGVARVEVAGGPGNKDLLRSLQTRLIKTGQQAIE